MSKTPDSKPSFARRAGNKVVAAAAAGAVLVAGAVYLEHRFGMPDFGQPDKHNSTQAKLTKLQAATLACRVYAEANVKGYLHSELLNAPGTGYASDLHGKDVNGKASKYGKTESLGCMQDPDVTIVADGKKQHVTVNLDSFQMFSRIDEAETRITNPKPAISSMGEGLSSFAGGVSKAVSGGHVNLDVFDGTVSGHESTLNSINAQLVINKVDTECIPQAFDQVKSTIAESYVKQEMTKFGVSKEDAKKLVTVDFTGTPNITANYDPFSSYDNTWYKLDNNQIASPVCDVQEVVLSDADLGVYTPPPANAHNLGVN